MDQEPQRIQRANDVRRARRASAEPATGGRSYSCMYATASCG